MNTNGITVEQLLEWCKEVVEDGLGDKTVLISDDDEGNGFHTLFYTFTTDKDIIKEFYHMGMFHDDNDPSSVVILG